MTDPQLAAAREVAEQLIRSGRGGGFADHPAQVRRLALLLIHEYALRNDSSCLVGFGAALGGAEALDTPWTRDDLAWALRPLVGDPHPVSDAPYWVPALIAAGLEQSELDGLEEQLVAVFHDLHNNGWLPADGFRQLARLYGTALRRFHHGVPADLLMAVRHARTHDPVLRRLLAEPEVQDVFRYAAGLTKPTPTQAWLRDGAAKLAAAPSAGQALELLLAAYRSGASSVHDHVDCLLRGLIWLQSRTDGDESTDLLSDVAAVVGAPVRRGAAQLVAPKAAVAVVDVLAHRSGDAPVRALARLSLTVRSKTLLPRVRAALERIGQERGWAPGEALELSVDDHGLDRDGRRVWPLAGGGEGVVEITGGRARLRAFRDGTPLRSVPPAWKGLLADARAQVTEINKTLSVERLRVEGLLSQNRVWDWDTWVRRYLDHPITSATARQLIWQTSSDGVTWLSGLPEWTGAAWTLSDLPVTPGAGWRIRLWHPAVAGTAEVALWRDRVVTAALRQPVKQSFREVYLLTPAEEQSRTYSNRFAAHVLDYRRANALMRERGWAANYLGGWSDGYHGEAKKEFGGGQWQAVFFHDWVESSTWERPYCTTDQVRFGRRAGRAWATVPLDQVPPLVFSEAMRDIDLFVGVTSIAADADWHDRGEDRFRAYWQNAAFAELSPRGEIRRDALARLLPRLAIGPRCELQERFLRVSGTLGAYRIHLGSANILMEPDDAYLCIVPDRGKATKLSLPFDDDPVLSVILSKAIMLAADDRIADLTITRQIVRSRL